MGKQKENVKTRELVPALHSVNSNLIPGNAYGSLSNSRNDFWAQNQEEELTTAECGPKSNNKQ